MERPSDDEVSKKNELASPTLMVYFLTFISQMCLFNIGFEIGSTSTAILLVQDIGYMRLTTFWKEIIVAGSMPSAAISSLIAAWFNDEFGRKKCIMFSCLCFILGAIITSSAFSREVLLVGRILSGCGIGFATSSLYVAECTPRKQRGCLVGVGQPLLIIGGLTASLISVGFSKDRLNGWRYVWGSLGVFGLVQFLGLLFLPESPRWFIQKSRRKEAVASLIRLRGSEDIEEELWEIEESFKGFLSSSEKSGESNLLLRMLKTQSVRRALIVGSGIHVFARFSGINLIIYYSGILIQMSGAGDVATAIWRNAIITGITCMFAIVAVSLIDRVGRRTLAIFGLFGLFISNLWIGTTFFMVAKYSPWVNTTDDALNSTCSTYSKCGDCIRDAACGFCYEDVSHVTSGACLQVSDISHLTSKVGACNSSSAFSKYSMKWVYDYCPVSFSWVAIIGIALYYFFFVFGMGHLPWVINAEIHPLWARSTSNGIGSMFAMTSSLIITVAFLSLIEAIHDYGVFFLMAPIALMGAVFCFFFLPETKNKSLEEIEALFQPHKQSI